MKSYIYVDDRLVEPITFSDGARHLRVNKVFVKQIPSSLVKVGGCDDGSFSLNPVDFRDEFNPLYQAHERHVKAVLFSSDAIMDLLLVCDAIKRMGGSVGVLTIPYMPYARQDRAVNVGEANGVSVMAKLINSIGARRVVMYDTHSMVTDGLIENLIHITQAEIISNDISNYTNNLYKYKEAVTISPDAGAEKKALKVSRLLGGELAAGGKIRCSETGDIVSSSFSPMYDIEGKDLLIVDDILDGGSTFTYLASLILERHKPKLLGLYVTHGIFSKGIKGLYKYFDDIYTCDYTGPYGSQAGYKIIRIEDK